MASKASKQSTPASEVTTPARKRHPINEYLLVWLYPILKSGYLFRFNVDEDVPTLPEHMTCSHLEPLVKQEWDRVGNLWRVFAVVCRKDLWVGGVASVLHGLLTVVARPLLLRQIVLVLSEEKWKEEKHVVLLWTLALCGVLVLEGATAVLLRHALIDVAGGQFYAGCATLIQSKSQKVTTQHNTTQESALLGNELFRVFESLRFAALFPASVVGLIGGWFVLVFTVGSASVVGILVMVVVMLLNAYMTKIGSIAEEKDLEAANIRLGIMRQMIVGIKAIKLCAWEENFLNKITKSRTLEMKHLMKFRTLQQSATQLGRGSPVIGAGSTFIFLACIGAPVTAADLFAALNIFLALRVSLIIIPESFAYYLAARVSLKRITVYLNSPEIADLCGTHEFNNNTFKGVKMNGVYSWEYDPTQHNTTQPSSIQIAPEEHNTTQHNEIEDGSSFSVWADFELPLGKSLAVVGAVGHGKTSLLNALLGEMVAQTATSKVTSSYGKVSFISQKPFILSGTIQYNIILDEKYNQHKLNHAVQQAAMEQDLLSFSHGLETVVGERGVTLSGGQQQRLCIARALYRSPQLIIADDPLAAVDESVALHLLNNAFFPPTHNTTQHNTTQCCLIMAVNQPQYLNRFDFVLTLKHGKMVSFLTTSEITNLEELEISLGQLQPTSPEPVHPPPALSTTLKEPNTTQHDTTQHDTTPPNTTQRNTTQHDTTQHNASTLISEDYKADGIVSKKILIQYIKGFGFFFFGLTVLCCVVTYTFMALLDLYFAEWVGQLGDEKRPLDMEYVPLYASICVVFLLCLQVTAYMFSTGFVRSSTKLHEKCLQRLLHAPVSWFNSTPSGRIISRFSSDLSVVDLYLSRFIDNLFQMLSTSVVLFVVIVYIVPFVVVVVLCCVGVFAVAIVALDRTNRIVKRKANEVMGEVQQALSEGISGRLHSRSSSLQPLFQSQFHTKINQWSKLTYLSQSLMNNCFGTSYFVSFFISAATALLVIYVDFWGEKKNGGNASQAGLAMTYSFLVPYFLVWVGFLTTVVMGGLSSLERVMSYADESIPQEPAWHLPEEPTKNEWPTKGQITFNNVSLIYRQGLKPALEGVSFEISGGEKVGIIGRTGAGKSSLMVLLLRINDPSVGKITIDGWDTTKLGLQTLRQGIAIVPQSPLLIRGSVLENVVQGKDTSGVEQAITDSGLLSSFRGHTVQQILSMHALTLSAGQKQLLSLARCLLNKNVKILVCDEPTSNVDPETDQVVQRTIKSCFLNTTTLTIAHRIETIVQSDRIVVLHGGKVVAFDLPQNILGRDFGLEQQISEQ